MSDYAERIRGWTRQHPTKTAVVEDILALRSNIVANMNEAGRLLDERLGRAEAALTSLSDDVTANAQAADEDVATFQEMREEVYGSLARLGQRVAALEDATMAARWRRMWDRLVAATWRLRMKVHVTTE